MNALIRLACVGTVSLTVLGGPVGCANHDRRAEIPSGAQIVAEGSNRISYTAPRDGMIWIFNQGNSNMEYAGRVRRGDEMVLDPSRDAILLNGVNVNDKPLTSLDQKRIFFQPSFDSAETAGERRVIREREYEERR